MNLDQFMNTFIPILIIFVVVIWLFYQLREPLLAFFSWIRDLFKGAGEKIAGEQYTQIVFER